MVAVGAVAGGMAHEPMAVAGGHQRHFLRTQNRVRVVRRARRFAALADRVLLFYEVDVRRHLGAGQRVPNDCSPGTRKKRAQSTAAVLDSQSVKNTATSTARVSYDAGKRIKGRKRFFLVDTAGNLLACWVVAAACHDGASTARLWDALALGNELLDRLRTMFVDGGFGRRFRRHLARRGVQAQVPSGVVADKGRFFIHAKRWVVERSIA